MNILSCPATNSDASDVVLLYGVDPIQLWMACIQGHHLSQEKLFEDFIEKFQTVQFEKKQIKIG